MTEWCKFLKWIQTSFNKSTLFLGPFAQEHCKAIQNIIFSSFQGSQKAGIQNEGFFELQLTVILLVHVKQHNHLDTIAKEYFVIGNWPCINK